MDTLFWKRLKNLCDRHETTPTAVCKATGISTGSVTAWKRGSIPGPATRLKIADYFGVGPGYFLSEETFSDERVAEALSDNEIKFAMFGTTEITDEMLAELRSYAEYLKSRKL